MSKQSDAVQQLTGVSHFQHPTQASDSPKKQDFYSIFSIIIIILIIIIQILRFPSETGISFLTDKHVGPFLLNDSLIIKVPWRNALMFEL